MGVKCCLICSTLHQKEILAIDESKHPNLIKQLTIAERRNHRLEKLPTVSYDLVGALRLALLCYEFVRE